MRPKDFSVLACIDPARVSRLAKQCRILQNPRSREIEVEHPLTKGFLLSRLSITRAEIRGFVKAPPGWKIAVANIDGRKRAVVAWPDFPDGGQFAQWFIDGALDKKAMTVTIGNEIFPVTIETGAND